MRLSSHATGLPDLSGPANPTLESFAHPIEPASLSRAMRNAIGAVHKSE